MPFAPPPKLNPELLADPAACERLRQVLDSHNYNENDVASTLGEDGPDTPKKPAHLMPRMLWVTRSGTPHETLIRLFLMNIPMDEAAARRALDPVDPAYWAAAGMLTLEGGTCRSHVRITPYKDLLLASDPNDRHLKAAQPDYVVAATDATTTLVHCMLGRKCRAALDIGSGTGVVSFMAAKSARNVCGVDCNPRAIAMSQMNARINRVDRVEFLEGSSFGPVEGRKFDYIISNPPFMISPTSRYIYRDSGEEGDSFVMNLARESAAHLNQDGVAQILGEFISLEGQPAEDRLKEWFAGSGCDVWFLKLSTRLPELYAEIWLDATEPDNEEIALDLYRKWMDYYQAAGIQSITTGLLNIRRADRKDNWFHFDECPPGKTAPIGDHIMQRFLTGDFLEETRDDEKLLAARLKVAPDLRLEQECLWLPGTWQIDKSELSLKGVPYRGRADRYTVALLARADGTHTVRDLLLALASAAGVQLSQVAQGGLDLVRHLLDRGFLLPVYELQ